jgi:hypothetical protein
VLVDVLGTNRSREDTLIHWQDKLRATCELTYYAVEPKTNGLFFAARRSSAESTYFEKSWLFFNNYKNGRDLEEISPTYMPTDGNFVNAPINIISSAEPGPPNEPNENTEPSDFAKMRKRLEQKLVEANSYIQAGNFTAAEKTINDIRSIDPDYPGLNAVYSRLEAAKNQENNNSDDKKTIKDKQP